MLAAHASELVSTKQAKYLFLLNIPRHPLQATLYRSNGAYSRHPSDTFHVTFCNGKLPQRITQINRQQLNKQSSRAAPRQQRPDARTASASASASASLQLPKAGTPPNVAPTCHSDMETPGSGKKGDGLWF